MSVLMLAIPAVGALVLLTIRLRKRFPARVNCWFCNGNFWVAYLTRKSWTCPKCEQYNGFSSDGNYNVVLDTRTANLVSYNKNQCHFPLHTNGLCRKCNMNQQLKIRQLACFIPMNEKNFDAEVDAFKAHLEKVYQLCSLCKKYLKHKLSSEKGLHLNTKLIESRLKPKKGKIEKNIVASVKSILTHTLKIVTFMLLLCILIDIIMHLDLFLSKSVIYTTKRHFKNLYINAKNISLPFDTSVYKSEVYKIIPAFAVNSYTSLIVYSTSLDYSKYISLLDHEFISFSQVMYILTIVGLILQLSKHLLDLSMSYRHIINDIIWIITIYNAQTGIKHLHILQACLVIILLLNTNSKNDKKRSEDKSKKLKHLSNNIVQQSSDDEMYNNDSDSDASSSFNSTHELHPFSRSPKYSPSYLYSTSGLNNSKSNSPFANNSIYSSCSVLNDMNFKNPIKVFGSSNSPNSIKSDLKRWDSDLDKSISGLSLGHDKKTDDSFIFSKRNYNYANPNIFMPSPSVMRQRPILSPSRLTHGTQQSWVAGGYWGADSPNSLNNSHETSSSSSQSSGFESLTSSMYRRNVRSFPPTKDDSNDYERSREIANSVKSYPSIGGSFQSFQTQKSPIFPSMNLNKTVFLPHVPFSNFNLLSKDIDPVTLLPNCNTEYSFIPLQKPTLPEKSNTAFHS